MKTFRIMRITVFLLFACILQTFASDAYSQKTKLSLDFSKTKLVDVLDEIEERSEFFFLYNENLVDTEREVTLSIENKKVDEILEQLFLGTDVVYTITDRKIILAPSFLSANEQERKSISGKVTDDAGQPLPGVTVIIKGTTNGTVTNMDGNYSITNIPEGTILRFSFVGMLSQEIVVSNQTAIDVILANDAIGIEEVVAVGYGVQKRVNLTGSVANVNNKLFENRPVTNVSSGLQGLLPGVSVTQSSGQPGSDVGTIRIRGVGTLNTADPMVLVDGVESTMNEVDANDIASISVLKDAASASIYGSKAANGVILIITKRGKIGAPKVSYSGNVGISTATSLPEFFSSAQVAEYYNAALMYEGGSLMFTDDEIEKYRDGSDLENYSNTDWIDLMYKTAVQHTHNINISGGSETARYMASVGYQYQDGIIDRYNKNQYNMRLNMDLDPVKNLSTNFSLSYTQQDLNEPVGAYDTGDVSAILRLANRISPMVVSKYEDGTYGYVSDGNPLAWIDKGGDKENKVHNLLAIASAKYNFSSSISLKAQAAYKLSIDDEDKYTKAVEYSSSYTQGTTSSSVTNTNNDRVTVDINPEFKKSYGKHNLDVLGGFHSELYKYNYTYTYRSGFPNTSLTDINAGSASTAEAEGYTRELAMLSGFGRINYNYAEKYLLEANVRYDGSSRFGEGNRWGTFPSVSAGWRISKEGFFADLKPVVNNLKIRASWGKLGNQDMDSYYPTVSTMTLGSDYVLGGNLSSGTRTYYAVNSNLQWEETTTWGIGVDASLLNKVNVTLDYYNKKTTGILMAMSTSAVYALSDYYANVGSVRNSGVEFSIDYNERFGKVDFSFGGNVAFNKNEVLSLGESTWLACEDNNQYMAVNWVGKPMNSFYGYKTAGFFQTEEELDSWAKYGFTSLTRRRGDVKYVDVDGSETVDSDDRTVQGSMDPKIIFGFNIGLNYKNFDLMAFFQGAGGVYRYIQDGIGNLSVTDSKPNSLWLDSWTEDNTDAAYPRLATPDANINRSYSDFWLQNSSYLRMKNLQIGYTLPIDKLLKIGVSKFRIYYSGQNLFTISGMLKGWDPEAASGRGNSFPQTKVNSIGLNLTF
jgi:TonB-linked SusC/RagA family outer membrane protein